MGALLTLIITVAYLRSFGDHSNVEHGRTMAILTLILSSNVLTAVLTGLRTRMAVIVIGLATLISAALIQLPAAATRLHLSPLHLDDWAIALVSALLIGLIPLAGIKKRAGAHQKD